MNVECASESEDSGSEQEEASEQEAAADSGPDSPGGGGSGDERLAAGVRLEDLSEDDFEEGGDWEEAERAAALEALLR